MFWRTVLDYNGIFKSRLNKLKDESRYRTFIELERQAGRHPHAQLNSPVGSTDG